MAFQLHLSSTTITFAKPVVMGILNITPDSFHVHSRVLSTQAIIDRAAEMLAQGAEILDLGGQSTRPGAEIIGAQEEMDRVIPALEAVHTAFPKALLSVDTYRSKVAEAAVNAGASIVNDVSAGTLDADMFATVGRLGVPYVLMHMRGVPPDTTVDPVYENLIGEIKHFFAERINELRASGVPQVILDPGFGFGKTLQHNYTLLQHLEELRVDQCVMLAGLSRKKMIQRATGRTAEGALEGTVAANTVALLRGADILRVHDVAAAVDAVNIVQHTLAAP